jgi:hypothetical protein
MIDIDKEVNNLIAEQTKKKPKAVKTESESKALSLGEQIDRANQTLLAAEKTLQGKEAALVKAHQAKADAVQAVAEARANVLALLQQPSGKGKPGRKPKLEVAA